MMGKKVSELEGAELDFWVAEAEGYPSAWISREPGEEPVCILGPVAMDRFTWRPSTAWEQGGPIIERERIVLLPDDAEWSAGTWFGFEPYDNHMDVRNEQFGPTALIAAMRAYVASKYGEEVPDQE